jgi:two-component system OmpR family sensor kinase
MPVAWTKSLRFQLTVWSLVTVALILLPAATLCYGLVRTSLQRSTDQGLVDGAAQILRQWADPPEAGENDHPMDAVALVSRARLAPVAVPGIGTDALYLRLAFAHTGRTAAVSPNLAARSDFHAALASLPPTPHAPVFAGTQDDDRMRCLTVALPHSPYRLQVAAPWDPMEDLLARLLTGLTFACLLFLLLSGVGSWRLVGRALHPIDHIVTEAEGLTADSLSPVLLHPRSHSDNEIGHLVTALNGMMQRLSTAFTGQRQFTADASHELRTPLTILRGELELSLSRERTAAEYRRTLESGLEEVERMTRIVESLGFLARGDTRPITSLIPVSFAVLAAEVAASLRRRAGEKSISLTLNVSGDAVVQGDPDALRRMARNLLENAITYTPPGGAITITVNADDGQCHFCVADTGVGIAPEDLPHIFDRFFRGDKARANTGGSGLGLSIVQSIVDAHGGEIGVESRLGQGSRFTVTLPAEGEAS